MADISKITLPSGNTYEIKDAVAREMISGGVSFIVAWDGTVAPVVAQIPEGVVVTYQETTYTGTLTATSAQAGAFYLVKSSSTPSTQTLDIYDEYVVVGSATKSWEKIGDTQLNLTDVVTGVTLNKQTDVVLGEATTFTASTPTITVTPSTTNIKATASGTEVGANGTANAVTGYASPSTDTFVKSVSAETNKNLVTTSVPNVTDNTTVTANKSTWSFTMGSGTASETLVIGGGNGSDVTATNTTLGTAITVATGATSTTGTGDPVVTGVTIGSSASALTDLGTPSTASVLTGVKVTTQPTIALATGATAGTGVISVATGITSASATQPTITVGTNDQVTTLKSTTDVNVTKGNS